MELTKETSLFKKDAIKTDVTAAAATATNYIDDVPNSSQTGMTLQPASNAANNYIQLDSGGLEIYKAGQLIASYGQGILLYHPGANPASAAVEITSTSARFTGQIQADSGYIGGWSIGTDTNKSLHNGAANVSPVPGEGKVILSKGVPGTTATGNLPVLENGKAWAFTAGNQFGVTTDGDLYASAAHLEGLSVGNYSDPTTNLLYGNCVWTNVFAEYFKTDLASSRHTYQGWTAVNTGNIFSFDSTNNWLVVDYSDHTTEAILQQNTGIVAPETTFTVSANLGTDCKVVFGGIEISGTDWQTADDGRKYATFTTTASATSGVFEIWPVASENYIFKGNRFKLEKSDSYSSWSTLDEQINKTSGAIGASSEATSSYFLNFTSTGGLKIAQTDPAQATTNYVQIKDSVKTVSDSTHFSDLSSTGLKIYSGSDTYPVASFGSTINLYQPNSAISLVSIDGNGAHFTGEVVANSGYIGGSSGWQITTNTIKKGDIGSGIVLSAVNTSYSGSIGGGSNRSDWRFTIGSNFGVTNTGALYANAGSIGGCTISNGVLKIKDANIDGVITANHIDTSSITLTTDRITSGSSSAVISGDGMVITKNGSTTLASFGGSEVSLYSNGSLGTKITSSGLEVWTGSKLVANFSSTATIGNTSGKHITVSSSGLTLNNSSTDILTIDSRTLRNPRTGMSITYAQFTSDYQISCNADLFVDGDLDADNFYASSRLYADDINPLVESTVTIHAGVITGGACRPGTTKAYPCGSSTYLWTKVYAQSGSIDTSDRKEKDILGSIDFAKNLIMGLEPIQYMWKDGDHRRTRMGFIAQDVAEECKQLGLNLSLYTASYKSTGDQDYDEERIAYYGEEVDDELLTWGLAYSQLIAPIVQVVQDQQKEIEQLKKDIAELKSK